MAITHLTPIEAREQSVHGVSKGEHFLSLPYTYAASMERRPLLPAWGSQAREQALRWLYRHQHNSLVAGVLAGIVNRIISTPYQISAPNDFKAEVGHTLLREALFGKGYEWWLSQVILNFLRHDRGVWIEKIGYGNPADRLIGAPLSIGYLDPLKSYPTGDDLFPVIYASRDGKWHKLHHTRVEHLLDMPDGDDDYPELGLCAFSRAVAVAEREILMSEYVSTGLDDEPQPGILAITNLTEEQFKTAVNTYKDDLTRLEKPVYGRTVMLFGIDPSLPIDVKSVPFSTAPEKFDLVAYTTLDANMLAAAIGIDILDFWQLSGNALGTGTQSEILAEKGKGKLLGRIYKSIQRMMNLSLLPVDCEFSFEYKDPQQDAKLAQVAGTWTTTVTSLQSTGTISSLEARQMLANEVESFRDVLLDADGQVRLPDDNEDEQEPNVDEVDGAAENGDKEEGTDKPDATLDEPVEKAFMDTAAEFSDNFAALVNLYQDGAVSKRSLSARLRQQLKTLGMQAFADGLEAGGVPREELDTEEKAQVLAWLSRQSGYIRHFADEITDRPLPQPVIADRASMWVRKSLQEAHYAGQMAADKNGMYEFVGEDGEENCMTCKAAKGQIHRMKTWTKAELRPGVDGHNYECKGFRCQHTLKRTTERARGRLYRIPRHAA